MRLACWFVFAGVIFLHATALYGQLLGEGTAHVLDARVIRCEQPNLTNICLLPGAHTSGESVRLTDFGSRTAPATPEWALSAIGRGVILTVLVQARRQVEPSWILGEEPQVMPWRHEHDPFDAVVFLAEPHPPCAALLRERHVYLYTGGIGLCASELSDFELGFQTEYFFGLLDAEATEVIANP